MARRRYLTSDISTDKRVNDLARTAGDFAALLYTWMIPHAADDATLPGDPEELLMRVCPGRRDKEPDDVAAALAAMDALGLIAWDRAASIVRFPDSFYRHQTYITEKRRGSAQPSAPAEGCGETAANQRTSAQNAASRAPASFSSSSSVSSSVSPSGEDARGARAEPAAVPPPVRAVPKSKPRSRIGDWQPSDLLLAWAEQELHVPKDFVAAETEKFRDHWLAKGEAMADWAAAWRKWLRNAVDFAVRDSGRTAVRANGRASPARRAETTEAYYATTTADERQANIEQMLSERGWNR